MTQRVFLDAGQVMLPKWAVPVLGVGAILAFPLLMQLYLPLTELSELWGVSNTARSEQADQQRVGEDSDTGTDNRELWWSRQSW